MKFYIDIILNCYSKAVLKMLHLYLDHYDFLLASFAATSACYSFLPLSGIFFSLGVFFRKIQGISEKLKDTARLRLHFMPLGWLRLG